MKTKFLQRVLWLVIPLLTMFNSQMYADAFEGFEYFSTSTSYTTQLDWSDDDADLDWRSQYGAVTTSSKRSGNNGFLLRNYKSKGNKGWLVTRTTVTNVTEITYYMKVTNTGVKHKVCYSTNGSTWTDITTNIGNSNTNWVSKTITVPAAVQSSALYFRWEITSSNSTNSNRDLYIDDVTFTVDAGSVATPTFNNGTGTYNNNVSVTINTETDGATIHYTTSGTAPTCSTGTTGTSVTISSTGTTLKAIACKDGSDASEVASATYTLKCATPTGLSTDTYVGTQTVTLATATVGADIYYTTDGSNPTASSTHYTAPFSVSSTSTIKAIAIKSNYVNSDIASATYTITPAFVVTWKNQGATVTTTNVASGSKPVFPDMSLQSGCGKYTYFYGWAEDVWSGEVSSPGTSSTVKVYKTASEMPNVSGDVTYYAVWGDSPGGWTKVSSIAAGDVVIFVNETNLAELTSATSSTTDYGHETDYSTSPNGTYPLTVEAGNQTGTYSFKNGSNYLTYSGTATSGSNYLWTTTTKTDNSSWTVSFDGSSNAIVTSYAANNLRYLRYNSNQPRFACYYSANGSPSQNPIQIYKNSAAANCVTSCCNQLAAPANPGETPNSTGAVLTWDAVTGATGYEVKIDGGEWTSTGNGTTTGYTITGKTCGGTSVSWQVRATGNGTTNCEKGAATTARNFTTTACACTNQYTYFWGTQITNDNPSSSAYASHHFECFNTWNSTEGKTGLITLPNSDTENYWFVGYNGYYYNSNLPGGGRSWCTAIYDMNYANSQSDGKVLGWNSTAYPRGATGYIRIYSDNTNSNKYAAFIPSGYILRWKNNRNSDAWTSYPFTDTGSNSYWETALVQLGADLSSDKVWVGLPTSGMSESFTWCGKSEEKNLIGVGKKTGASTWADNGIVAGDANQWGKWRIEITNNATNWNVHFVPYWKATYDVNGGGAISPTATNEGPVSCEGDATARQVTMPAAPTWAYHEFDGWLSSADAQTYAAGATVSLTQNTTFTAQWHDASYNISATMTNVTSATSFPVAYTYTGSAANVTYTFVASSGYRLPDAVTVTMGGSPLSVGNTGYTWDKTTGQLQIKATITADVAITIGGTQTHTVTWKVTGSADNVITYDHGEALVLPTPDPSAPSACSEKRFVGWKEGAIDGSTDTPPTLLNPSSLGTVTADKTYYAVFADEGSSTTYTKVTDPASLRAGDKIVIICNSTNYGLRINNNTPINSASTYADASTITPASDMVWTLAGSNTDGFTLSTASRTNDGAVTLGSSSDPGNNSSANLILNNNYNLWKFSAHTTSNCLLITKSTSNYRGMEYYNSGWKVYNNSGVSSNAACAMRVYRKNLSGYVTTCSECVTPSDLEISDITSTGATVTWDGVSQTQQVGGSGTGYKVAWNTSNSVPGTLNASNSADVANGTNTYDITGLTAATQYYVFVQSKCDDSWSSSVNFHTNAKITYAANGGTGDPMPAKEVVYNAASTVVDACTFTAPSGKKFNGWVSSSAVTVNSGVTPTTAVPGGATINNLTQAITLTAQWRDLASYTVNFSADNGTVAGGTSTTVYEDGTLTFPNVSSTTCGVFQGWVEAAYDNTTKPSGATFHEAGDEIDVVAEMADKTYYAVYRVATGAPTTMTDNLVPSDFNATSTTYVATNNLVKTSPATYEAVTANGYSSIQINKISDGRGIVSKISGGVFKGITLTTNTNHSASRKVYVYGSDSYTAAYADPAAFNTNSDVRGTLLATLSGDTKTYNTSTDDYEYIAIFADGAGYLDQISLTWYGSPSVYQTSPSCSPTISLTQSLSSFTYVYSHGPSASQSFTVSGTNLGANLVVTAPTNYEVCKTADGTYASSVSYTPSDGTVTDQTVYIRLAGGLNVGTYNYDAASGLQIASTGATTRTAALSGSVTKETGAIAFTDFNAVDHYEAELTGSSVDVTLTVSVTGDGSVSYTRSPAAGSSAVPSTTPTTTLHTTTTGTWTVTATLAAGTNYTGSSTSCTVIVYKADRFYDNVHGNDMILKRNDAGEDHYTIPTLTDESRLTSGSCSETHYHFMGWVPESALSSLPNDAAYDAVMITGGGTQSATGTNYYAVWAEE